MTPRAQLSVAAATVVVFGAAIATLSRTPAVPSPPDPQLIVRRAATTTRIAAIGDYGVASASEASVAALVHGWQPDLVITMGDNNYPNGAAGTIDENIGQFYRSFIAPYRGRYGEGAKDNRFFPSLGNHDWRTFAAAPYLEYFELPGNERYYDLVWGPVHLFAIDSDPHEPDGITASSVQAQWLERALAASGAPWKLVYFHHAPYSSGEHGGTTDLRWPFAQWGATAVLSGHDHHYERLERDGVLYFVNGLSGNPTRYAIHEIDPASKVRVVDVWGAIDIEASQDSITFRFVDDGGREHDRRTIDRAPQ